MKNTFETLGCLLFGAAVLYFLARVGAAAVGVFQRVAGMLSP